MDNNRSIRYWVIAYFLAQALAVGLWWVLLVALPNSRGLFFPLDMTGRPLMALWPADLIGIAGGSVTVAFGLTLGESWAKSAAWCVSGALLYATTYCFTLWIVTLEGIVGLVLMTVSMGLTMAFTTIVSDGDAPPAPFRRAQRHSRTALLFAAGLQIVVFWVVFLAILPAGVLYLQDQAGIPLFANRWLEPIAGLIFIASGFLGLGSTWETIRHGHGTPLPTECAPLLITSGPYAWVRNPMAIAGIVQGVAVGLWLGSWPVMLYSVCGGLLWHTAIRPVEEADLVLRFGDEYRRYKENVACWRCRLKPYRTITGADET